MAIFWSEPNIKISANEYFSNADTRKVFKANGIEFSKSKTSELVSFLSSGKLVDITLPELKKSYSNLTLTPTEFNQKIKSKDFKRTFDTFCDSLVKINSRLVLPAPIIIKFGPTYYGYSDTQGINVEIKAKLKIKVWLIKCP